MCIHRLVNHANLGDEMRDGGMEGWRTRVLTSRLRCDASRGVDRSANAAVLGLHSSSLHNTSGRKKASGEKDKVRRNRGCNKPIEIAGANTAIRWLLSLNHSPMGLYTEPVCMQKTLGFQKNLAGRGAGGWPLGGSPFTGGAELLGEADARMWAWELYIWAVLSGCFIM